MSECNQRIPKRLLNATLAMNLGMGVALGLSGCSATSSGAPRAGALSKMKTYLAVGDKPLPVVSGEPGSSIQAAEPSDVDVPAQKRTANTQGRISGRVFDSEGKPVRDARVRVAVNGAAGGKVVKTTTDRSGGFTLHGLRPGTVYTVIAESEGEDGPLSGRAEAETADSGVKITLDSGDAPLPPSGSSRVNRVSDRDVPTEDAESTADPESRPGAIEAAPPSTSRIVPAKRRRVVAAVNEEDLPPATEAENLDGPAETARARPAAETWRRRGQTAPASHRETEPTVIAAPEEDIEGPNPLPPALEPGETRSSAVLPREDSGMALRGTARRARSSQALRDDTEGRSSVPDPFQEADRPARDIAIEQANKSVFEEPPVRGSKVVVPESFTPLVLDRDPFATERARMKSVSESGVPSQIPPPPDVPTITSTRPDPDGVPASRPARPIRPIRKPAPRSDSPEKGPSDPKADRRKTTWRDLSISASKLPPLEGEAIATAIPSRTKTDEKVVHRSFRTAKPGLKSAVRPEDGANSTGVEPSCDYDDRHRQVVDFRLPTVAGKSLSLKELDADLILLDFWGTWCDPCLRSVPHLVDIQNRLGKKIAVVGIACEPDGSEKAVAKVAETVERLKINYPVLLSRNDGTCPVQNALHVQAFPTMILMDRQGRILWRDQGATRSTLARLDRQILDAPSRSSEARRY